MDSATRAPPSRWSSRANACAIRSRGSENVTTPHPSTPVSMSSSPTSAASAWTACIARCTRCPSRRYPSLRQPFARQSASMPACLPEQLWLSFRGGSPAGPHSSSSSVAGAFASSARTASSCAGSARWEAEAIARSRASTSPRARASGTACRGFEDERMKQTRAGSPASAITAPSCTATAWTRWRASTMPARRTITVSGSMARGSLKISWPAGGLWRHSDFLKLWGSQTISEFGSQVTLLALPYAAVKILHASAFAVASLTVFEQLPFLFFALPAVVWIDRVRRQPLLIAGDLGRALALASIPIAYAFGVLHMWQLFVVAFAAGILTVFFDVAYQSYLPSLVGREHLVEANAKLQATAAPSQSGGPAVGGAVIGAAGAPYAILIDIASFLASAAFVLRIRGREETVRRSAVRAPSMRADLLEGLRYVLANRLLRAIAATTAARNFFAAVGYAILIVYAVRALHLSAALIGVTIACSNVGYVIGALTTRWTARQLGIGRAIVFSAFVVGISVILIPLSPVAFPVPLIVVGLMLYSYGGVAFNITQISLRQAITPDRLQGRMNSVMRFILWGAIPLGALLGGGLAATIGLRAALFASGGGVAISWLPVFFSPVRRLTAVPAMPEVAVEDEAALPAVTGVDA